MEVSVKQLKQDANQTSAKDDNPLIPGVAAPSAEKPLIDSITRGNIVGGNENLEKRRELISEKSAEPTDFAFERAIGKNDSLYTNFAELIALTKRKVGRIVIKTDGKRTGFATGFMVSNRLLLTNWHVFENKEVADESEVHFFYELDIQGHPLSPVIFRFDTAGFFNNRELDYCFVAVKPKDVTDKVSLDSIGYLYLDKTLGKLGEMGVEKLNIVHHPQGDYKQISIRENTFVGIEPTKIFYETDTAQGSSGSPVFNDQWQVVALHHKSVAKMNKDNQYLDQDDQIIPVINGNIDIARVVWLRNEGMRISVILNHVSSENPTNPLIAALTVPPPLENLSFTINGDGHNGSSFSDHPVMTNAAGRNININVPLDALNSDRSIEISLSGKMISADKNKIATGGAETASELALEAAKANREKDIDFSACTGYDPKFLGRKIPLPRPMKAIEKQIARLENNEMELKYFKYSVIFNAETHMPLISAVNVDGDPKLREDKNDRSDNWLRDRRIDFNHQLDDKYYAGSNFARGHMSRFEDANWDITPEDERRNGVYTCFYTNACPQVAAFNGPGGLWGQLEKTVLENGIKKQKVKKQARMTVFNGPIFSKEKDRSFRGFPAPMEFFKIILWLNDAGQLRATAFKLSQADKIGIIKFDELMNLEALDVNKDGKFKEFQCSVKSLGKLTRINFKQLEQFDTFIVKNGVEEKLIVNTESITL